MQETPIGLWESVNSRGGDCVPPDDILLQIIVWRYCTTREFKDPVSHNYDIIIRHNIAGLIIIIGTT